MAISGRPTNLALLKITQGSSGAEANAFQKTRNAAGTPSESRAIPACAGFRLETMLSMAMTATASRTASKVVAMIQLRRRADPEVSLRMLPVGDRFGMMAL